MNRIILLVVMLLCFAGCNRPKNIPDDKLESIFKEIFLANAYHGDYLPIDKFHQDSMDMYSPILAKYGYKPRDVVYTIRHFSKRKSSRLTDIINAAVEQLDKEYAVYERAAAMLDTVEIVARRRYSSLVRFDSVLKVYNMRDTSKLRISLDAREGMYNIKYRYFIDTLDKNSVLKSLYYVTDSVGNNIDNRLNWLSRGSRGMINVDLPANSNARKIIFVLSEYNKTSTTPNIRIDSLQITHYLPKEVYMDSLYRAISYKLVINGHRWNKIGSYAQDSSTLHIHPPRISSTRGDNR